MDVAANHISSRWWKICCVAIEWGTVLGSLAARSYHRLERARMCCQPPALSTNQSMPLSQGQIPIENLHSRFCRMRRFCWARISPTHSWPVFSWTGGRLRVCWRSAALCYCNTFSGFIGVPKILSPLHKTRRTAYCGQRPNLCDSENLDQWPEGHHWHCRS